MPSSPQPPDGEGIARDLVALLHQGAPAEAFAARLAEVESLPEDGRGKSSLVELVRMAMAVHNRLELWQQRESGLLTVIESARDLTARLELDELLRTIASRARNMLGSHVSWLSTYDSEAGEFHVLAADGALARGTGKMATSRDRGIVSVVMETRLPFSTPDYLHDTRFPHDPDLDQTFRDEGIAAVVGVPLLWEADVIGLLFVADRYHRTHTAQNVSILSTLAAHAAVAIKNAMAFRQAQAALRSAETTRAELELHARRVQGAAEAHGEMTSLLARGAPLAALCESLARLLDGGVIVLDEAGQAIGRGAAPGLASAAMAAYAPHAGTSSALTGALRQSRQIGRSVVAFQQGEESCRAIAVIGGNDVLGAVLLFRRGELDEIAVRTFERSATVIGVVLLSRERMEATKTRDVATLLRALLSPRQDDLALQWDRALGFGLDLTQPVSLLVVEIADSNAGYAARRLRAAETHAGAVFDEIDGALVLLTAATRAEPCRRSVAELAGREFGSAFLGVVSRPLSGPAEIPATYTALRRALPVLRRIGIRSQIVPQNEMALYSTLFETHDQDSLAAFLAASIGALTGYDQKRGTELAPTLLCYFDAQQNAKVAAQRLGIHVNTVRQRLGTIEDLLGHWGSATRVLEIHIALRLWTLGDEELRRKVAARLG
ncbi:GAF domain-containing protein [Caenimonas sedimenti]|uniref:GAF domain-containing protein n=1 Tax=Caenimonas sedimenti TaxID=2596921 RepID=A0A562ZJY6_9BURK|nr:GAF domain-containing protein [Caenimonas sedimenti]TWO68902.1 GAF domain-containing protein [Caenimonas sedimenti]